MASNSEGKVPARVQREDEGASTSEGKASKAPSQHVQAPQRAAQRLAKVAVDEGGP